VIDYLLDVKPLQDQGLDYGTIAAHLSARTKAPIPCDYARIILTDLGAVVEDPVTGERSGTLINHYLATSGQLKEAIGWFISHCFGAGDVVDTTEYPRSIQFGAVEQQLPAELEAVALALINSASGRPDAGTNADDVIDAELLYNVEQAEAARQDSISELKAEIENTWINPAMSDGVSTEAEVRAAIKAGL